MTVLDVAVRALNYCR